MRTRVCDRLTRLYKQSGESGASQLDSAVMNIHLATLPNDVETLQRLVRSLAAEHASPGEAKAEIERLNLIIEQLQRSQ